VERASSESNSVIRSSWYHYRWAAERRINERRIGRDWRRRWRWKAAADDGR